VVVALRERLVQLRVEIEGAASVFADACAQGELLPELIQEGVALVVQLVEQADDREAVVGAVERRVVELVHEVRLQGEGLTIDGVLGRRVPVHLVKVEPCTVDPGVSLGRALDAVHDLDGLAILVFVVSGARLEELEAVACVLHVGRRGTEIRGDGRRGRRGGGCGDNIDGRLLVASDAEAAPCGLLHGSVRRGL